jgi:hypothetical protein
MEISEVNLDGILRPRGGGPVRVILQAPSSGALKGAWVLSSETIDASGHVIDSIPVSQSGPCGPPRGGPAQPIAGAAPGAGLSACFAEMKRLGYRQRVSYSPSAASGPSSGTRRRSTPPSPSDSQASASGGCATASLDGLNDEAAA